MDDWLRQINMLELSPVKHPANRKRKLHQKAKWSTAYINDLPDSAFLYVESGGEKDDEGKTRPRTLRHFPVKDHTGKLDRAHVANAISRIPQSTAPGLNVKRLQAKARALLEEITKSTEDLMVTNEALQEYLSKASLPEEAANVVKSIVEAMTKSKGDLADDMLGKVRKGIASLMGFDATSEEVTKAKETIEAAKVKTGEIKEVVKSAVTKLQGEKPPIGEIVNALAELAGVTPTLKRLEQLPPELKAEWEAMQKSSDATQGKLEALQKKIDEGEDEAARREMVAKATELQNVPAKTEDIGNMLHVVTKADAKAGETLLVLLKSVDEVVKTSQAMAELGSGGIRQVGGDPSLDKLQAKADGIFEKSTDGMTKEQAFTKALELHPELYTEHLAANR